MLATSKPHRRQSDGVRTDYFRNKDLLAAFGAAKSRDIDELVAAFVEINSHYAWSENFNALRAGEALGWGVENGIVERIQGNRWKLLERELQFELVGPVLKQRAIRVRGLAGAEGVIAAKLWKREQGRRARAHAKVIVNLAKEAAVHIDRLLKNDPLHELSDGLAPFRIGSVTTVAGARTVILETFHVDADLADLRRIERELQTSWRASIVIREERRQREAALVPAEDLAELGELFL